MWSHETGAVSANIASSVGMLLERAGAALGYAPMPFN
jgi:hypothetical protein